MIITFSGCSGSGKTTVIKEVLSLNDLKSESVSVKQEDSFLFVKVAKIIFGKKSVSEYVESKKRGEMKSRIWVFFYACFVYIEFFLEYLLYEKIFYKKIVFRDRYIIDYLVTINNNLGLNSDLITKLYKDFPRTSLSFYIDINDDTAIKRNTYTKSEGWTENPKKFILKVLKSYQQLTQNDYIYIKSQKEAIFYINLKLKMQEVKTISFAGVDGTGKTTLVKNFAKLLKIINIDSEIIHFYHDNLIFKFLKSMGIMKIPVMNKEYYKTTRQNTKKIKLKGKSFIWATAHFVDSYIQYLISRIFINHKVILFDRYFYDYLISFKYLNIKNFEFFAKFIPKPDIGIVVVVRPAVAHERKPENNINFFRFCDIEYKRMSKQYQLFLLDANDKSENQLIQHLVKNIII